MSDIITIGNALIDAFLHLQDANTHVHINNEEKLLSVDFGQKIMLDSSEFLLGGNAANVAVGLSRLGHTVSLMAELGNDEFADKIIHTLHKEHVNTTLILHSDAQSSFAMNLTFHGERTIFVQHQKRSHAFNLDQLTAKWIYLTSMGESWKHVYQGVISHMKKHPEQLIACNPGTKQFNQGRELVLELLPLSTVFIANKEEYLQLLDTHTVKKDPLTSREILTLVREQYGGKILVLTDGQQGAYALDETGKAYHVGVIPIEAVGKTGAGDGFSTGFLASYIDHADILEALRLGTANAASVVSSIGAQTGLLHKHDLHLWREKMQHVIVHES
jgi:sugar/nucleoside kinase (ribokinase family)